MRYFVQLSFAGLLIFMLGCKSQHGKLITEKIVYDVSIRNTDVDADWWRDNLPGPARDHLVKWLMDGAKSGKITACNSEGIPMNSEDVKNMGSEILHVTFQRPDPPYEDYDTTIRTELDYRDITRVRFMEEWYYDKHSNLIEKKVIAMAPVVENYAPDGKFRGYEALFWVFGD